MAEENEIPTMTIPRTDWKRYQWLRRHFAIYDLQEDGTYRPKPMLPDTLPLARSLDDSIDLLMKEEENGRRSV